MIPVEFPEANTIFGPPEGMTERQVLRIPGFSGQVVGGSMDGTALAVCAWKPLPEELAILKEGGVVFLSFLGGMPPHYICTDFKNAVDIT